MTTISKYPIMIMVLLALSGCGSEAGNPKKPTTAPKQSLFVDTGAAMQVLSVQIDESIDAATSEISGATEVAGAGLGLKGSTELLASTPQISCEENSDKSATVRIERSGASSRKISRRQAELESTWDGTSLTIRTWKHPSVSVGCENSRVRVRDWSGVQMKVSFEHKFRREIKSDGAVLRSTLVQGSGSRELTWESASLTSSQHSVLGDSSRVIELQRSEGPNETHTVTTRITEALAISTERTRGSWQSRTISSGRLLTEIAEDSQVILELQDVKLERTGGCAPTAGLARGTVLGANGESELRTFVVDFTKSQVTWNDGSTADYVPDSCAVEEDSGG
jgi:hypothetical protein